MDPHDRELLEFARRWEHFGGPSDADILVEFGMTPSRFSERLEELRHQRSRLYPTTGDLTCSEATDTAPPGRRPSDHL
ncbi:DUF3263 domain-containing protein [Rhodococcus sp. NPDC003318]|uniref:DUF3263 domain-containing protein n=1 Tax=Rhodococcus sp. NPDC003318 TaxID=3364503 RepID=UPI0036A2C946